MKEEFLKEIESKEVTDEVAVALRDKIKDKTDAANKEVSVPIRDLLTPLHLCKGGDVVRQLIAALEEEIEEEPHITVEGLIEVIGKLDANLQTYRQEAAPVIQGAIRGNEDRKKVQEIQESQEEASEE